MKLSINPLEVYFSDDWVEFEICGVKIAGELKETAAARCEFTICEHYSDDEAENILVLNWEALNDQLTYIYFNRPCQPEVDRGDLSEMYKGFKIVYLVGASWENFTRIFYAGWKIETAAGDMLAGRYDNLDQAINAIDNLTTVKN